MTTLNPFREGSWEYYAYNHVEVEVGSDRAWDRPAKPDQLVEMYDEGAYSALFQAAWLNTEWWPEARRGIEAFVKFLAGKQHDYGTQNILKFGVEGIKVRMWDKIARIGNLEAKHESWVNESIIDSYTDLAGYVVLYWMVNKGQFEAPLEAEMPEIDDVQKAYMEAVESTPMDMHEIIPTYGDDVYCYYQDSVVLIPNGGIVVKDGIKYPTFTINRTRMI